MNLVYHEPEREDAGAPVCQQCEGTGCADCEGGGDWLYDLRAEDEMVERAATRRGVLA